MRKVFEVQEIKIFTVQKELMYLLDFSAFVF